MWLHRVLHTDCTRDQVYAMSDGSRRDNAASKNDQPQHGHSFNLTTKPREDRTIAPKSITETPEVQEDNAEKVGANSPQPQDNEVSATAPMAKGENTTSDLETTASVSASAADDTSTTETTRQEDDPKTVESKPWKPPPPPPKPKSHSKSKSKSAKDEAKPASEAESKDEDAELEKTNSTTDGKQNDQKAEEQVSTDTETVDTTSKGDTTSNPAINGEVEEQKQHARIESEKKNKKLAFRSMFRELVRAELHTSMDKRAPPHYSLPLQPPPHRLDRDDHDHDADDSKEELSIRGLIKLIKMQPRIMTHIYALKDTTAHSHSIALDEHTRIVTQLKEEHGRLVEYVFVLCFEPFCQQRIWCQVSDHVHWFAWKLYGIYRCIIGTFESRL